MTEIIDRYDTFPEWPQQLRSACEAERLEDAAALLELRPPRYVALHHWTVTRREEGGLHQVVRTFEPELRPYAAMATTRVRERPEDLPPASPESRSALLHALLHEAAEVGGPSCFWARSLDCLRVLIEAGADVEAPGWMGLPLVVHVAQLGNLEMLRFLVGEQGADVNEKRERGGYSALHWASGVEVLRYLVARGADATARTADGDSVVAQQVRLGHAEEVAWLLGHARPAFARDDALHWVDDRPDVLDALLEGGVDPHQVIPPVFGEDHDTLLLHRVLREGVHRHVRAEDPEARRTTALTIVACVDRILGHGFDAGREDGSHARPYHIVVDHRDRMEPALYAALEARLRGHDGPRRTPPDAPRCTCGLRL